MDGEATRRVTIALDGGQLVLHYQPIVEAETGAVRALETLARWRPADGKLRGAGWLFGRLGRDPELLRALDRNALALFLEDRAATPSLGAARLSINHDAASVSLEAIKAFVDSCAGREGGPIALELFEHLDPAQLEAMPTIADELAGAGIEIWHDDFGTGERALPHLIALPSTAVKLCPELAPEGVGSARVRRHVRSLIGMLHDLGKIVIAEGVQDQDCAEWLGEAGADWFQGWLYARPMPALDATAWLEERQQRAA